MIEYEAKVLNVDPADVEQRVLAAGGHLTSPRRLMRRYVYDVVAGDTSQWLRLRDTGSEVTLTHKQVHHDGIDGVEEHEIVVGDFEATNDLLAAIGFTAKGRQENWRTSYVIDGVAVECDRWPMLDPYVEVEGACRDDVVRTAKLLGYREDELTTVGTTELYARAGLDLNTIPDLRFE